MAATTMKTVDLRIDISLTSVRLDMTGQLDKQRMVRVGEREQPPQP
jgi:hypothetical protein